MRESTHNTYWIADTIARSKFGHFFAVEFNRDALAVVELIGHTKAALGQLDQFGFGNLAGRPRRRQWRADIFQAQFVRFVPLVIDRARAAEELCHFLDRLPMLK